MYRLEKHVRFLSGSPQFRITESDGGWASEYWMYSQSDLLEDLTGVEAGDGGSKKIRTADDVSTLYEGDIIFSLISGNACIVSKKHEGYLYTQNYIKLFTDGFMDSAFLVYLLNEDKRMKKQFWTGLQGSFVLKYTLKQLKELELPPLPSLEKQRIIGAVYLKQLKVEALKKKAAQEEKMLLLGRLERICYERDGCHDV